MKFAAAISGAVSLALMGSLALTTSSAAQTAGTVTVAVEPVETTIDLGATIDLTITITNNGQEPTSDLLAHLDVTTPDSDGSVDPEDWTPALSKSIGPLAAGDSITLDWTVQPIAPGRFLLYAVSLESTTITASNLVTIEVIDRRSLNSGGMLPISLGVPAVIGAALVGRLRRR